MSENDRELVKLLWQYYQKAAEIKGWDSSKPASEREDGEKQYPQANFSLFQFFTDDWPGDPLTWAFLGDRSSKDKLAWGEKRPDGWQSGCLENRTLNESQEEAVAIALASPISFIQGPPGTGKTETILNLACCAARLGNSVAIVSSNNSALENVKKKIWDVPEGGAHGNQPNWSWLRAHFACLGKKNLRKEFRDTKFQQAGREAFRFTGSAPECVAAKDFLTPENYPVITSTIHSLKKCFSDGMTYRYDYVIMDESSQTDPVAGLVAMSAARHLVLVGDPNQLPPVIKSDLLQELANKMGNLPEQHVIREERSFLDVCLDVFRDYLEQYGARTTLRYHYRCHPGIIRFCDQAIYQKQLKICTPEYDDSVTVPIKLLWFEGDYCEWGVWSGKKDKTVQSKHNIKQVRCFLEEEWPRLRERLQQGEHSSVCILSPFRGQLLDLQAAINEYEEKVREKVGKWLEVSLEGKEKPGQEEEEEVQELPALTIHKAQGREYDIVCLLPVEDGDWEWPWSQQKRLINVAASRAKRELRVILSSALMDQDIQKELTQRPIEPTIKEPPAPEEDGRDQRYLQKLVKYVKDENQKPEKKPEGIAGYPESGDSYEYGFHKSARASIFDQKKWRAKQHKERVQAGEQEELGENWAPEACMEAALVELMLGVLEQHGTALTLYKDVPLLDVRNGAGEQLFSLLPPEDAEYAGLRNMVKYGHFDFVLCQGQRILLVVEADGHYHRERAGQEERDRRKDRIVRDILGASYYAGNAREGQTVEAKGPFTFIRMPDDGSTCLEIRSLWTKAPEAFQKMYFPLEELLTPRLDQEEDGTSCSVPVKSITNLVSQWDDPEGSVGRTRVLKANKKLRELGLIGKLWCDALDGKFYTPTRKGQKQGILKGIPVRNRKKLYSNVYYPERIQETILEKLNCPLEEE